MARNGIYLARAREQIAQQRAENEREHRRRVDDALKAVGCDTAKSVLELSVEEIASRADLEMEQAQKVVEILKAEFE